MEYKQVKKRDERLCVDCGQCLLVCPMDCFGPTAEMDDFENCGACGMCKDTCPLPDVIVMED